jgi:hypothetical protein
MIDACRSLEKLGYWPGYFHREVANLGGVQAAENLLDKPDHYECVTTREVVHQIAGRDGAGQAPLTRRRARSPGSTRPLV